MSWSYGKREKHEVLGIMVELLSRELDEAAVDGMVEYEIPNPNGGYIEIQLKKIEKEDA